MTPGRGPPVTNHAPRIHSGGPSAAQNHQTLTGDHFTKTAGCCTAFEKWSSSTIVSLPPPPRLPFSLSSSLAYDVSALPPVLGHGGPPASFYRLRRRPRRMRF